MRGMIGFFMSVKGRGKVFFRLGGEDGISAEELSECCIHKGEVCFVRAMKLFEIFQNGIVKTVKFFN